MLSVNLLIIAVWLLLTVAVWWLPTLLTFIVFLLNLLIHDPIPYTDEVIMFAILIKQIFDYFKQKHATQKQQDNVPSVK